MRFWLRYVARVLRKLFSSEEPLTPDPSPRSGARGDRETERQRDRESGLVVWWFARVPTTAAKADRLIRFPLQLTAYSLQLTAAS